VLWLCHVPGISAVITAYISTSSLLLWQQIQQIVVKSNVILVVFIVIINMNQFLSLVVSNFIENRSIIAHSMVLLLPCLQ
jgi:hypothetical protein